MTEKIRVTIYIEKGVWGHVQKMAFRASSEEAIKSKSSWIEDLIKADIGNRVPKANFEDKRVAMPIDPPVRKESKVESDTQIIANGQAKLDAIRKSRNIKQDKIAKVREKCESITGFSGGYSKDHQTRKKGVK